MRVRINLLESLLGPAMVLRLIPQNIPTIDDLNLPQVLKELAQRPKGMLLVTGPTGSGKSTTLAAIIDHINRTMKRHILTIEDPVEFVHKSRQSLIRQREVGSNTKHFKTALRAALREDPDVILVGEIRDQDTLSTAIEASQTGHLLLGTLHTNSAVRAVERMLGMYPTQEQEGIRRAVSDSLLGVISQGLIKTVDSKRVSYHDVFINTDACRDYIMRAELDEIESVMERSALRRHGHLQPVPGPSGAGRQGARGGSPGREPQAQRTGPDPAGADLNSVGTGGLEDVRSAAREAHQQQDAQPHRQIQAWPDDRSRSRPGG